MRRRSVLSPPRARRAAGAALALVLTATAAMSLAGPVSADDGRPGTPAPPAAAADVKPGETASWNMEHTSNVPKNGALQGTGSDIAFQGKYAFAGNYDGFTVYDLSNPAQPVQALQVLCPGSQNDVSVYGDLLVLSTDSSRSDDSCESTSLSPTEEEAWEGIKIWDISNPLAPEYVKSVETACGSHTHSLAPTDDGRNVYVYVSSYFPDPTYPDCQPPHDSISIVKVPTRDLAGAELVATPNLFPDGGLTTPGGDADYYSTSGCHDITTYVELDLAAGACMGDGILLDISDRENPEVISNVQDTENFAFWHSATFNNDGTKVVFTDELGGGGLATCTKKYGPTLGANGIYDIVDGELEFRSYYKIPRMNTKKENCVAHNGSLVPVEGKDIMVQSWYQGGTSVFDFTDSSNPVELAWFDRGEGLSGGGTWSSYYYNGFVYSNDLSVGFDTFKLDPSVEGDAGDVRMNILNPQTQQPFSG